MQRAWMMFAAGAALAALTCGTASLAGAAGAADGWTDQTGIAANATASDQPSSGRAPAPCTYEALSGDAAATATRMAQDGLAPDGGQGPGVWLRKICTEPGHATATIIWVPAADPSALA